MSEKATDLRHRSTDLRYRSTALRHSAVTKPQKYAKNEVFMFYTKILVHLPKVSIFLIALKEFSAKVNFT